MLFDLITCYIFRSKVMDSMEEGVGYSGRLGILLFDNFIR